MTNGIDASLRKALSQTHSANADMTRVEEGSQIQTIDQLYGNEIRLGQELVRDLMSRRTTRSDPRLTTVPRNRLPADARAELDALAEGFEADILQGMGHRMARTGFAVSEQEGVRRLRGSVALQHPHEVFALRLNDQDGELQTVGYVFKVTVGRVHELDAGPFTTTQAFRRRTNDAKLQFFTSTD